MSTINAVPSDTDSSRRRPPPDRTVPQRSAEFEHLDLPGLREYRKALDNEEHRVSYWRRLIQARLDLLRTNHEGLSAFDHLQGAFAEERPVQGRNALLAVIPDNDIPPIPDLQWLWNQSVDSDDPAAAHALAQELSFAEFQLSTYRQALHRRLQNATNELIARYHEDPLQCLIALPLKAGTAGAA
ncbi:MAG: hypothetical protein WCL12_04880 [Actinomycetes bacterium]|nr:hypothetical protein [Actinomycetota bacterium]